MSRLSDAHFVQSACRCLCVSVCLSVPLCMDVCVCVCAGSHFILENLIQHSHFWYAHQGIKHFSRLFSTFRNIAHFWRSELFIGIQETDSRLMPLY